MGARYARHRGGCHADHANDAADHALQSRPRGCANLAAGYGNQPYLVTHKAVEHRIGRRGRLSPDELIDACEEHEPYFATIAVRKLVVGEVDPDGRAVIMACDVKPVA